ncbi:MAG: c-type cytochrome [Rhodospirillales bacterium]|nr:c-type cytochrome [Rhodospirillales bacterium]MBO6785541.1 c-type cytochrome [Rhodospirillales bacterium]
MKRHVTAFATAAIVGAVCTAVVTPATAADGEKVFNKCKACHALEAGKHKVGPSLAGVVGRQAGTAEGFGKYKGLEGADWVWDEAALMGYLEDPKDFVKAKNGKRTSMVLKLRKEEDRKAVIEFLKQH